MVIMSYRIKYCINNLILYESVFHLPVDSTKYFSGANILIKGHFLENERRVSLKEKEEFFPELSQIAFYETPKCSE